MERFVESLLNIEIMDFTDMDIAEESVQYNDVRFKLKTLAKYDGMTIEVNTNWDITVWDEDENLETFNIIENEEFQQLLLNKITLK